MAAEQPCYCVAEFNARLAEHNTRISEGLVRFGGSEWVTRPSIASEQIETGRGKKKAVTIMLRHRLRQSTSGAGRGEGLMLPLPHPRATMRIPLIGNGEEAAPGQPETSTAADVLTEGGDFAMESFWRPGPLELEELNRGGGIVLLIHGSSHPVVNLGVTGADQLPRAN